LKFIFLGKGLSGFLHWKIAWFLVWEMKGAAGTVNEVEKFQQLFETKNILSYV